MNYQHERMSRVADTESLSFDNDRSVIMSRIDNIERNEPRRSFLNIFYKLVCVHCIYLISESL